MLLNFGLSAYVGRRLCELVICYLVFMLTSSPTH